MRKVLFITGPTAVGKTRTSIITAEKLNGEIISADSRQFYKYMDIGTAKPEIEDLERVPHHFINILTPDKYYSSGKFGKDARKKIDEIFDRNRVPIVTGGSGLYLKAVYEPLFDEGERDFKIKENLKNQAKESGLEIMYSKLKKIDPDAASKIMPNDKQRIIRALEVHEITGKPISSFWNKSKSIDFTPVKICLTMHRELLYQRINKRVESMLKNGFINEVKILRQKGYSFNLNALKTVGYKEINLYLEGEFSYTEMVEQIKRKTRNYAKRQITWFKKEKDMIYIDVSLHKNSKETADKVIDIYNKFP